LDNISTGCKYRIYSKRCWNAGDCDAHPARKVKSSPLGLSPCI